MRSLEKLLSQLAIAKDIAKQAGAMLDQAKTIEDRDYAARISTSMLDATHVLVTGHFEGFIRNLLLDFFRAIENLGTKSEGYPHGVLCQITARLGDKIKSNDRAALDKLISFLDGGDISPIAVDFLAKTHANPSVDVVENNFAQIGIENVVDVLSVEDYGVDTTFSFDTCFERGLSVKIHDAFSQDWDAEIHDKLMLIFDSKWPPKKKRRNVGYVNVIQSLLERRNKIAHGEDVPQITAEDLLSTIEAVEKLGKGLGKKICEKAIELNVAIT